MKAIRVTEDTHVTIMDNLNSVHTTAGKVVESAVNIVYKSNNVNVNNVNRVAGSNSVDNVDQSSDVNHEYLLNEETGKLEEANAKIKALEKELGDKNKAHTEFDYSRCPNCEMLRATIENQNDTIEGLREIIAEYKK